MQSFLPPHALSAVKPIGDTVQNFIDHIENNTTNPTLKSATAEDKALFNRSVRFKDRSFPPPADERDLVFSLDHLKSLLLTRTIATPSYVEVLLTRAKKIETKDLEEEIVKLREITFPAGVKYPFPEMKSTKDFWKKLAKLREEEKPISLADSREEWARMTIRAWYLNESEENRAARLGHAKVLNEAAKKKGIIYTDEQRTAVIARIIKLHEEVMNKDATDLFRPNPTKKAEAAEKLKERVDGKPATDEELYMQLRYLHRRGNGLNNRLEDPDYQEKHLATLRRCRIPLVIELGLEMKHWTDETIPKDPLSPDFLVMDRVYLRAAGSIRRADHPEATLKNQLAGRARVAELALTDAAAGEKKRAREARNRLVTLPAEKKARMLHRYDLDDKDGAARDPSEDSEDEAMFEAGFQNVSGTLHTDDEIMQEDEGCVQDVD